MKTAAASRIIERRPYVSAAGPAMAAGSTTLRRAFLREDSRPSLVPQGPYSPLRTCQFSGLCGNVFVAPLALRPDPR